MKFKKRAKVEQTDIYRRRIWDSLCGFYRVSEFTRLLEHNAKVFKAEARDVVRSELDGTSIHWKVISEHRKPLPAFKACVNFENARREKSGQAFQSRLFRERDRLEV